LSVGLVSLLLSLLLCKRDDGVCDADDLAKLIDVAKKGVPAGHEAA
jgi:hypothetical protein